MSADADSTVKFYQGLVDTYEGMQKLSAEHINKLRAEIKALKQQLDPSTITELQDRVTALEGQVAARQATIDALMLEHCPDEMTPLQMKSWARSQRSVGAEETAKVEAALKSVDGKRGGE